MRHQIPNATFIISRLKTPSDYISTRSKLLAPAISCTGQHSNRHLTSGHVYPNFQRGVTPSSRAHAKKPEIKQNAGHLTNYPQCGRVRPRQMPISWGMPGGLVLMLISFKCIRTCRARFRQQAHLFQWCHMRMRIELPKYTCAHTHSPSLDRRCAVKWGANNQLLA